MEYVAKYSFFVLFFGLKIGVCAIFYTFSISVLLLLLLHLAVNISPNKFRGDIFSNPKTSQSHCCRERERVEWPMENVTSSTSSTNLASNHPDPTYSPWPATVSTVWSEHPEQTQSGSPAHAFMHATHESGILCWHGPISCAAIFHLLHIISLCIRTPAWRRRRWGHSYVFISGIFHRLRQPGSIPIRVSTCQLVLQRNILKECTFILLYFILLHFYTSLCLSVTQETALLAWNAPCTDTLVSPKGSPDIKKNG